ncbi:alpha/beta fold hydrolase [Bacillus testis]|uniref:alpha/beta fold hydrolase n=1 Tax=Bacillus testis TaxID=1622072 RepID=UPI00067F37B6|nr:alpha/beta hydrolase [Bacillus testis]
MWERLMVETSRGIFEVFKKGEGKPLCVTHLYSEYNEKGNLFAGMFTEYYTVYLANLRGAGQSTDDTLVYSYSMHDSVEDLEAIRAALHKQQWAFAGHSTGGMLALKYAVMHPESLEHIVAGGLCASSAYMKHAGSIYCRDNPNNKRIRDILAILGDPDSTLEERRAANKEWTMMSLYNKQAYEEMRSRPDSGKTVAKRLDYFSYEELKTFDLRPELARTETRAYIYCGKHDAQCPHEFSVEAAQLMPKATMHSFEYSNHFPFIEEEDAFKAFIPS